jgi:hypothetical protein
MSLKRKFQRMFRKSYPAIVKMAGRGDEKGLCGVLAYPQADDAFGYTSDFVVDIQLAATAAMGLRRVAKLTTVDDIAKRIVELLAWTDDEIMSKVRARKEALAMLFGAELDTDGKYRAAPMSKVRQMTAGMDGLLLGVAKSRVYFTDVLVDLKEGIREPGLRQQVDDVVGKLQTALASPRSSIAELDKGDLEYPIVQQILARWQGGAKPPEAQ